jgi:hypothetical protein
MATTEKHTKLVQVTVTITDASGTTTTQEKEIPSGPTDVPVLKMELGVAEADSLFFVREKKKQLLADHEQHNVKEGDHFEVVSKGGVS